jgi:dTDP-glucose 4,6-dehydratase
MDISSVAFPSYKSYFESLSLDYVVHFAAESHVDNSITGPRKFIDTNIVGTFNLLENLKQSNLKKFIHISTDEVFGSLNIKDNPFDIDSPYRPNSPYAASKAASDLLVRSYFKTYKFPAIITNCSNNFGPRQFPEKLIPLAINKLKSKEAIPVYGTGENVRDWVYVKDHVNAIVRVIQDGIVGKQYLIGGDNEISNSDLIQMIKDVYEELTQTKVEWEWYKHVEDRKGHDYRYAINNWELKQEFPNFKLRNFRQSLKETVQSYL